MKTRIGDTWLKAWHNCTDGATTPSYVIADESVFGFYVNATDPKRLRGPITFSGTPAEVVQKLRRWSRGLPTDSAVAERRVRGAQKGLEP